jgi:hypothetical protein
MAALRGSIETTLGTAWSKGHRASGIRLAAFAGRIPRGSSYDEEQDVCAVGVSDRVPILQNMDDLEYHRTEDLAQQGS